MNIEIAPTMIAANWDDARLYCFSLNVDGKTGWRLPTRLELLEIYQSGRYVRLDDWCWSATEYNDVGAWVKLFGNGRDDVRLKETSHGLVMAVRDLV
jgi:hypothetical protein